MRNLLGITLQTKSNNVIQFSNFNSSKLLVEVLQRDIITFPLRKSDTYTSSELGHQWFNKGLSALNPLRAKFSEGT